MEITANEIRGEPDTEKRQVSAHFKNSLTVQRKAVIEEKKISLEDNIITPILCRLSSWDKRYNVLFEGNI